MRPIRYRPRQLNPKALKKIAIAPMDWHGLPLTIHLQPMGPAVKSPWATRPPDEKIRYEAFKLRLPMKLLLHRLPHQQFGYDFTAQLFTINSQSGAVSSLTPHRFHNILTAGQANALRGQVNYFRSSFIVNNGVFYIGRVVLRDNYSQQLGSVTVPLNAFTIAQKH